MEKEIWKPIKNFEGFYFISSYGKIRSVSRPGNKNKNPFLRQPITKGYCCVNLSKNNIQYKRPVHILVCKTFNIAPNYYECIEHLDSNPLNNFYKNLKFSTYKQNSQTAVLNGSYEKSRESLRKWATGKIGNLNPVTKNIIQLTLDGKVIKEHVSATFAAKELGICRQHISQCCTGYRNKCGGFKWKHKI